MTARDSGITCVRRSCSIVFACVITSLAFAAAHAQAPAYPSKPVRIVVSSSPGGNLDLIARAVAQKLTENLAQPMLVENKPGGSGIIAHEFVAKARPDGYTLMITAAGGHTINPGLFKKLPYDTVNDFTSISIIARGPLILVAHPSLPVKSLRDLIALAKSKPGEIVAANGGMGTSGHLALELMMTMTGTKFLQVPYKGNPPGLTDTIAGHTSIMVDTMSTSIPLLKSGRLRAIAVTSLERSPLLPNVPSVAETLPGFEASVYIGLFGPAGMPREIVKRLSSETAQIAHNIQMQKQFADMGVELVGSTPEEFLAFIKADIAKWKKVIRQAGIELR
ncbi:MAG: tripartite tricarboxylate transporter substrate binding protein [Pseudomonadota bacterium]